jgi:hypothetical protein
MKCPHCSRDYPGSERRCPHCDEPNPASGVFQTSSVLISVGGSGRIYRSVEELPPRLRTKLRASTNSENSATILIADRRGRSEIAKALRALPATAQRRLTRAVLGETAAGPPNWLRRSPGRAKAVLAILLGLTLAAIAVVLSYRG